MLAAGKVVSMVDQLVVWMAEKLVGVKAASKAVMKADYLAASMAASKEDSKVVLKVASKAVMKADY